MTLSPAEVKVLRLRAEGLSGMEVAYRLGVSDQTVKNHLSSVYRKLDATNSIGAMFALGWVHIPGYEECGVVARCTRRLGHRGQHGGFRRIGEER